MCRLRYVFLVLLAASTAGASQLETYKDWLRSPEAYFLTEAERREWRNVRTDEEAAVFVAAFVDKRGGEAFLAEIEKRTRIADKYFGGKDVEGTSTLRGKLVILFGAPLDIKASGIEEGDNRGAFRPRQQTPGVTDLKSDRGRGTRMIQGAGRRMIKYTLIFPADTLPAFDGQDYTVDIDLDLATGKDRLGYGVSSRKLDALIAAAIDSAVNRAD